MTKILIIGASGFLGSHLLQKMQSCAGVEIIGTYNRHPKNGLEHLDISDGKSVESFFRKSQPDIVINAGNINSSEYVKNNPEKAFQTNLIGNENVVNAMKKYQGKLVFISSTKVYGTKDGDGRKYDETSTPNPPDLYSTLKLQSETYVSQLPNHLIIRPSNIYGSGGWFLNAIKEGGKMKTIKAQPVFVEDIVEGVHQLIEKDVSGIFNFAGPEVLSNFDLAQIIEKDTFKRCYSKISPLEIGYGNLPYIDTTKAQEMGVVFTPAVEAAKQMCERKSVSLEKEY